MRLMLLWLKTPESSCALGAPAEAAAAEPVGAAELELRATAGVSLPDAIEVGLASSSSASSFELSESSEPVEVAEGTAVKLAGSDGSKKAGRASISNVCDGRRTIIIVAIFVLPVVVLVPVVALTRPDAAELGAVFDRHPRRAAVHAHARPGVGTRVKVWARQLWRRQPPGDCSGGERHSLTHEARAGSAFVGVCARAGAASSTAGSKSMVILVSR